MSSAELIKYLKRLEFTDYSYDRHISLRYMNVSGSINDIDITICKELDSEYYHNHLSGEPDIFNIKYIYCSHIDFKSKQNIYTTTINKYTIDGVIEFLVDNRIGNKDVLREAVIELNCHRLLN